MLFRSGDKMDVILLEDVKTLGKKGEVIKVSEGYARNFILKKNLGIEATSKNLNDLKLKEANNAKIAKDKLEKAKALSEDIKNSVVTLKLKVGVGGKTFGSISAKEIALAAKEQLKLDIDKKKLVVTEPIKSLGGHVVQVKLHPEVTASLNIKVVEE